MFFLRRIKIVRFTLVHSLLVVKNGVVYRTDVGSLPTQSRTYAKITLSNT